MKSHERFLESWERNRQKGKVRFIVANLLIYSVVYWILILIYNAFRGNGFTKLIDSLLYYIAGFIGGSVGFNYNWYRNENKYNRLLSK